jgi:hypothetical protein
MHAKMIGSKRVYVGAILSNERSKSSRRSSRSNRFRISQRLERLERLERFKQVAPTVTENKYLWMS